MIETLYPHWPVGLVALALFWWHLRNEAAIKRACRDARLAGRAQARQEVLDAMSSLPLGTPEDWVNAAVQAIERGRIEDSQ